MRVAITGIGYIGPGATSWEQALDVGPAFAPWPDDIALPAPSAHMGLAPPFPRARFLNDRQAARVDRLTAITVTATGLALEDANLSLPLPDDTAAFFATCQGEIGSGQRYAAPLFQGRPRMLNPGLFPQMCRNLFCGQIAITFDLPGPGSMMSGGPLAGLHAVARAARAIRRGQTKVALAGAAEALSRFSLDVAHRLYGSGTGAKPRFFAREAGGLIPAEGAAMLVLEDGDAAQARGARIYALLDDCAFGRAPDGQMAAMDMDWNKIGLVSTGQSGAAQPQDIAEQEIWRALGGRCPPLAAARALTGEALSMASVAELVLAAKALAARTCPPVLDACSHTDLPVCRVPTPLTKPRALVCAMDKVWNYGVLTLSEAP